jgi:hypothetical protein
MPKKRDRYYSDGKLKTWSQRRCIICQRFLTINQKRFCDKHNINPLWKINDLKAHRVKYALNQEEYLIKREVRRYSYICIKDFIDMCLPHKLRADLGLI